MWILRHKFSLDENIKKAHYQVTNDKDINGREREKFEFFPFFFDVHGVSCFRYALFNILKFSGGGKNYFPRLKEKVFLFKLSEKSLSGDEWQGKDERSEDGEWKVKKSPKGNALWWYRRVHIKGRIAFFTPSWFPIQMSSYLSVLRWPF